MNPCQSCLTMKGLLKVFHNPHILLDFVLINSWYIIRYMRCTNGIYFSENTKKKKFHNNTYCMLNKVRTSWETHKIWKNLPHGFDKSADLLSKRQNHEEDFFKLCVLLKKSELYTITWAEKFINRCRDFSKSHFFFPWVKVQYTLNYTHSL